MATLVAERILRTGEGSGVGQHARRFAIVSSAAPDGTYLEGGGGAQGGAAHHEVWIVLLSPYVTLATNHRAAHGTPYPGSATDALKVLYSTTRAALGSLGLATSAAAKEGCGPSETVLVLPDAEHRLQVIHALEESSSMLHPSARCVGGLRVGYLPVAPTWN